MLTPKIEPFAKKNQRGTRGSDQALMTDKG